MATAERTSIAVPIITVVLAVLMFREQIVLLFRMVWLKIYIVRLEWENKKLKSSRDRSSF